jgi:hypothetical protein
MSRKSTSRFPWPANLLSYLSPTLMLLVIVVWLRSYWVADVWEWERVGIARQALANSPPLQHIDGFTIESDSGGLFTQWYRYGHMPVNGIVDGTTHYHLSERARGYPDIRAPGMADKSLTATPSFLGIEYGYYDHQQTNPQDGFETDRGILIPYAALVLIFMLRPATKDVIALLRHARARRLFRKGICGVCGYDLRASSDHCPECGTKLEGMVGRTATSE